MPCASSVPMNSSFTSFSCSLGPVTYGFDFTVGELTQGAAYMSLQDLGVTSYFDPNFPNADIKVLRQNISFNNLLTTLDHLINLESAEWLMYISHPGWQVVPDQFRSQFNYQNLPGVTASPIENFVEFLSSPLLFVWYPSRDPDTGVPQQTLNSLSLEFTFANGSVPPGFSFTSPVPEPGTISLGLIALAGLTLARLRPRSS
jgi:hypothetical protein